MTIHHPVWWDEATNDDLTSQLDQQVVKPSCDVAIIGGGFTGLTAGIELLKLGYSVQIFEKQQALQGASARAFGSIAIGCSSPLVKLQQKLGKDHGERVWLENSFAAQNMKDFITDNRFACDFYEGGHIKVALAKDQAAMIEKETTSWQQLLPQADIKLLDSHEVSKHWPGVKVHAGLLDEESAAINPYKLSRAMLLRFLELGGTFNQSCAVTDVKTMHKGLQIRHEKGVTACNEMLQATNGYTDQLCSFTKKRILPVGSYMIASKPLSREQVALFGEKRRTFTTAFNFKQYCRVDHNNRLVFGGRFGLSSGVAPEKAQVELNKFARYYFPELEFDISHVWGGNLGMTFDLMPHVGYRESGNNRFWYAMGYCGRGLPMTVLAGQHVARQINESLTGGQHHDSLNMQQLPFHAFPPLKSSPFFLPLVTAWYRWLDRRMIKLIEN